MGSQGDSVTSTGDGWPMPRHSAGHKRWSTSASSARSRCAGPRHCRPPPRSPRLHSGWPPTRFPALVADSEIHNAMRNRRPIRLLPSRVPDREFSLGGRDTGHAGTDMPIPVQPDLRLPATPARQIANAPLLAIHLRHWKVWKRRIAKRFPFRAEIVNPERNGVEAQFQLCFKQ